MIGFFKKADPPEYNQFIAQIEEIARLERTANELYRFTLEACKELDKYTKDSVWREKLDVVVRQP